MPIEVYNIILKKADEYKAQWDAAIYSEVDEGYNDRCAVAKGKWVAAMDIYHTVSEAALAATSVY